MSRYNQVCAGLFLCAFATLVFGNDSTGFVSTGGVQYLKNNDIRMVTEDLFISVDKVRVQYEFHNDADHDITETVLFPLPSESYEGYDGDFADISELHHSFKIWVNGASIKPTAHYRAIWGTRDITDLLKSQCGLTQNEIEKPYIKENGYDLSEKGSACLTQLNQLGMIQYTPYNASDDANASSAERQYVWQGQIVYSWQQVFPKGQSISVKHEYQPLVGGGVMLGLSGKDKDVKQHVINQYCIDNTFMRKLRGQSKQAEASYQALGYILTTGANWAKPIERFHLTIDKPKGSLMSLCWDASLKKVSDTRFEATKTNFTPKHDIDVVFANPINFSEK